MINISRLKGIITERGLSQRKVAEKIGITEKTFYEKMKKGVFSSAEIDNMITILQIENPMEIFFVNHVSQ